MYFLFQKSRPDRYVALFGEFHYDPSKWRPSVAFVEQLRAFQELIDEGKVSNIFQISWIFSLEACKELREKNEKKKKQKEQ